MYFTFLKKDFLWTLALILTNLVIFDKPLQLQNSPSFSALFCKIEQ